MLAAPRRAVVIAPPEPVNEPAADPVDPVNAEPSIVPAAPAAQDNTPSAAVAAEPAPAAEAARPDPVPEPSAEPAPVPQKPAESATPQPAPLFRSRRDIPKAVPAPIPAVIPLVRAPDDPGVDEDGPPDEFAEQIGQPKAQAGGWRGFLSRWGGS